MHADLSKYDTDKAAQHQLLGVDASLLVPEFDRLIGGPYFGLFDRTTSIETVDFEAASSHITDLAPCWHSLLCTLLSNQRTGRSSYKSSTKGVSESLVFLITALVCRARSGHTATSFPKLLGVYLYLSGVKRLVLEVLPGLGLVDSYEVINRLVQQIASHEQSK